MRRCLLVFSPPDGGVPEIVKLLAIGLRDRGWDSWVAGPESASIYDALEAKNVPIVRLPFRPGYRHALHDVQGLRSLIALLRRRRFDVVHARSNKSGILGRLAARATGIPAVYDPAGWTFHPAYRGRAGRAFSLTVERLLAPLTRACICVSESERRLALEHRVGPPGRFHVVLSGVPGWNGTVETDPEVERFSRQGPLAACMTALRPEKGVDVFLNAAPHVLGRLPEARLAVIGNGPLRGSLRRQARTLGVDDRVRFFDYRAPSARQLRSLDVFVHPTPRYEAFGIALVEAMACGVPQVTTAVGGASEVVRNGETGLFCKPNDPVDLAMKIVRLLQDDDLRARMSIASRERQRRFFNAERMIGETAAVYDLVARRELTT
jgi:glycosyltransferase involved in cell wall biosynthesis